MNMRIFEGYRNGINLGGWISQFKSYDVTHFDTFITEENIKDIASMGFDHVRVPVDYIVLQDDDGNLRETGFGYLDKCRKWCRNAGLKMIIDLHECYGFSFDPGKKDDKTKFFYDEDLQERFLNLWEQIALRFGEYHEYVAFEPLNEVVNEEVKDAWNIVVAKFIRRVRKTAPVTDLIIGGVNYNNASCVKYLNFPLDDHIVYNFHCYEPFYFTHQGAFWIEGMPLDFRIGYPETLDEYKAASAVFDKEIGSAVFTDGIGEIGTQFFEDFFASAIEKAEADNVPLYCGEYGVVESAESEDIVKWLKDVTAVFNEHGIGHAMWNYKGLYFGLSDPWNEDVRKGFSGLKTR